ncbi:MAG: hypothetical protein KKH41_00605 [Candidatus Thermoplasmatota archaeon]|nr:hypothetical protein [Euryarchaeota archaeon]MBU4145311.1 hypothetical protein [Candidatus Thermoplasmatota archaeon]MBU4591062.1 hypothetical protein [Candidatus Thermoplasmatota archaeon]
MDKKVLGDEKAQMVSPTSTLHIIYNDATMITSLLSFAVISHSRVCLSSNLLVGPFFLELFSNGL